ncbi:hypothetical protein SDC9_109384 [bioreactor metagenome]|uniref:Uncharacterized protein n=1 Tax=bioreactor metagenome TaxID=1076179 RepID=A0A645BCZ1_9ZZZZ
MNQIGRFGKEHGERHSDQIAGGAQLERHDKAVAGAAEGGVVTLPAGSFQNQARFAPMDQVGRFDLIEPGLAPVFHRGDYHAVLPDECIAHMQADAERRHGFAVGDIDETEIRLSTAIAVVVFFR